MEGGRPYGLKKFFLNSPRAVVSDQDDFVGRIREWKVDPCEGREEISKRKGNEYQTEHEFSDHRFLEPFDIHLHMLMTFAGEKDNQLSRCEANGKEAGDEVLRSMNRLSSC
jgi:hypothetical protein